MIFFRSNTPTPFPFASPRGIYIISALYHSGCSEFAVFLYEKNNSAPEFRLKLPHLFSALRLQFHHQFQIHLLEFIKPVRGKLFFRLFPLIPPINEEELVPAFIFETITVP